MAMISSIGAGVGEPGCRCVSQIVEMKIIQTCHATGSAKAVLEIGSWLLRLLVERHILGMIALTMQIE
jgi:hypothetical protein